MSDIQLQIISVKKLLQEDLKIPSYQRPYKWTEKNVHQLIDDIIFHKDKSAYRLGTVVIHNEMEDSETKLNIVDGQQRALTLTLIAYAIIKNCEGKLEKIIMRGEKLDSYKPKLVKLSFANDITKANIQNNYKVIERRIDDFDEETIRFFYEKCELVKVVLMDISEAFQFFDSQNARGKDLDPHDLLKAFHLREMNNYSTEGERLEAVYNWEATDKDELAKLFALYLFRIRNWSKGYSARYFTKNDVDVFKGVSPDVKEEYPFAKANRIAHFYTENYKKSFHRGIDKILMEYPFQIDQTIINGKRFFEMIAFYGRMETAIKKKSKIDILSTIKNYEGKFRTGDKYIRNLFYCGLIYYVDRFGEQDLQKAIEKIFVWAYTLRLKLQSVGLDSIDNYALGKHQYSKLELFKLIREAVKPTDILNMKLEILKENKSTKTTKIVEHFKVLKYYE
ncbi:MAG: DUF262 domain-containing protein [Candidatus Kapabacteria bacterium]|nr:DUF262 domain-containing protein [Candidatus Kapabacteria bacterium]